MESNEYVIAKDENINKDQLGLIMKYGTLKNATHRYKALIVKERNNEEFTNEETDEYKNLYANIDNSHVMRNILLILSSPDKKPTRNYENKNYSAIFKKYFLINVNGEILRPLIGNIARLEDANCIEFYKWLKLKKKIMFITKKKGIFAKGLSLKDSELEINKESNAIKMNKIQDRLVTYFILNYDWLIDEKENKYDFTINVRGNYEKFCIKMEITPLNDVHFGIAISPYVSKKYMGDKYIYRPK